MQLCKLTTQLMTTHNDTQWTLGEWHSPAEVGIIRQCSPTALHCYPHPLVAVLMNPVHASIEDPRIFSVEVDGAIVTDGTKCWTGGRLRLVEELVLPAISTEQRIKFAILCARKVCIDRSWLEWAERWLSGEDRTVQAARAADAARAAAAAAAYAADAARAAYAADAAAYAAYAADAAYAAAAAAAAAHAADAAVKICLTDIAEEALR